MRNRAIAIALAVATATATAVSAPQAFAQDAAATSTSAAASSSATPDNPRNPSEEGLDKASDKLSNNKSAAPAPTSENQDPSSKIKNQFDKSSKDAQEQINGLSSKLGLSGKTSTVAPTSGQPSESKDKDSSKDKLSKQEDGKILGLDKNIAIFAGVIAVIAAIGGAVAAFLPQIPGLNLNIPGFPGR